MRNVVELTQSKIESKIVLGLNLSFAAFLFLASKDEGAGAKSCFAGSAQYPRGSCVEVSIIWSSSCCAGSAWGVALAGIALVIRLIPPEIMAQHRNMAAAALDRPVSWTAGIVIVTVWLSAIGLTVWIAMRYLRW